MCLRKEFSHAPYVFLKFSNAGNVNDFSESRKEQNLKIFPLPQGYVNRRSQAAQIALAFFRKNRHNSPGMIPIRWTFALLTCFALAVSTQTADVRSAETPQLSLNADFREGNGVFAPGQSIILDVILRPLSPNSNAADTFDLQAVLTALPDNPPIGVFGARLGTQTPLPIPFVTPDKEGVYEITLTVNQTVRLQRSLPNVPRLTEPALVSRTIAEIRRQFVVLPSEVAPRTTGSLILAETRNLSLADESSADSPSRRLLPQLHLPRITDLPRPAELLRMPRPFSRQNSPETPPEELFNQLFGGDTHFLPLDTEIGKPYLIEIDYPVNIPQTLGVGIVDYLQVLQSDDGTGTGVALLRNTAANIHIAKEIAQDPHLDSAATHRLLFWAETEHPKLVVVNRQLQQEELPRNIRISRVITPGLKEDQRLPKLFEGTANRRRIGQILGEYYYPFWVSTEESQRVSSAIDWRKTYEETSRLLDTLHRGGYDGVTLTILSQGQSHRVKETLDGYELMFRRFSSEGLTLIPAIKFDMPLPSLEQLLQQHPGIIEEIVIGTPEHRKYNLLHPAVQQAMAETVLELVDRFGHHPSFGGVAVVLSPESYAQLPFVFHPPDDFTFAQFRHDTEEQLGVPFPDEQHLRQTLPIQQFLENKNAQRVHFLRSDHTVWATWVRWRAAKVSGFYANLATQIAARRSDAPLYLLGGTMLEQPEIQQFCTPTLPRNIAPLQAIQLLGFDLPTISRTESLHFLKPVIVSETRNHSYEGLNSTDIVPFFFKSGMLPGVQFVHGSGGIVAGSRNDYFVTTPAHIQSRKRFVRQLAQADVPMFIDAGVTLPFGQESQQFDLLATFRRLPPVPFQTFQASAETQPLTIRYQNLPDGMVIYIVNDVPFSIEADFFFTADFRSTITELTGHRMIRSLGRNPQRAGSHTWRASLAPYDLLAIQINDSNARLESVQVHRPSAIESALRQKVEELVQRVHAVRGGVPFDGLLNADFELPPDSNDGITGWQSFGNSLTVLLDHMVAGTGQNSVRLTNVSSEPGTFLSQPFDLPATGRLDVSMFVGVPAETSALPMSVVLSARNREQPLHRSVPVGETLMLLFANVEPRNGIRWHQVVVPFRLPLEPLDEVRIGVQYSGIGTVWLDDVVLRHVSFSQNEMVELQKKSVVADQRSTSGRVSELLSLLESHWVQLLFDHIPVHVSQSVISTASSPATPGVPDPPKSATMYQRVRGWFGIR